MLAAQKSESRVAARLHADQTKNKNRNSATVAAAWKYRVLEVFGRFVVMSPTGLAIEDCASPVTAWHLAAAWNGRMGLEVRA